MPRGFIVTLGNVEPVADGRSFGNGRFRSAGSSPDVLSPAIFHHAVGDACVAYRDLPVGCTQEGAFRIRAVRSVSVRLRRRRCFYPIKKPASQKVDAKRAVYMVCQAVGFASRCGAL